MLNSQSGFDTIAANDRLVYSFALQRKNADSGTDVKALVLANSCKFSKEFNILFYIYKRISLGQVQFGAEYRTGLEITHCFIDDR